MEGQCRERSGTGRAPCPWHSGHSVLSTYSEDVTDVLCLSVGTTKREPSTGRRVRLRDPRHVTAWSQIHAKRTENQASGKPVPTALLSVWWDESSTPNIQNSFCTFSVFSQFSPMNKRHFIIGNEQANFKIDASKALLGESTRV